MMSEDRGPDAPDPESGPVWSTKLRGWLSDAVGGASPIASSAAPSSTFVVVLELLDTERGYAGLTEALQGYPKAARLAESAWIIASPSTVVAIRDDLKRFIGDGDRLFVATLSGPMAFSNTVSSTEEIKAVLDG